jgi:hypothetical protein
MRVTKTMSDQSVDTINLDSIMISSYIDESYSNYNKNKRNEKIILVKKNIYIYMFAIFIFY